MYIFTDQSFCKTAVWSWRCYFDDVTKANNSRPAALCPTACLPNLYTGPKADYIGKYFLFSADDWFSSADAYDPKAVCLCFEVYVACDGPNPGPPLIRLTPVISNPIFDKSTNCT